MSNFKPHLQVDCDIEMFRQQLLRAMGEETPLVSRAISPEEHQAALALRETRYLGDFWNYGLTPPKDFVRSFRFACGDASARLKLAGRVVTGCRILGDFLIWCRWSGSWWDCLWRRER